MGLAARGFKVAEGLQSGASGEGLKSGVSEWGRFEVSGFRVESVEARGFRVTDGLKSGVLE